MFSALIQKYELEVKEGDLNALSMKRQRNIKMLINFDLGFKVSLSSLDQYRMVILENLLIEKLDSALKSKGKGDKIFRTGK